MRSPSTAATGRGEFAARIENALRAPARRAREGYSAPSASRPEGSGQNREFALRSDGEARAFLSFAHPTVSLRGNYLALVRVAQLV